MSRRVWPTGCCTKEPASASTNSGRLQGSADAHRRRRRGYPFPGREQRSNSARRAAGDVTIDTRAGSFPKRVSHTINTAGRTLALDRPQRRIESSATFYSDSVRVPSRQLPGGVRNERGLQRRASAVRQSHRHLSARARSHHRLVNVTESARWAANYAVWRTDVDLPNSTDSPPRYTSRKSVAAQSHVDGLHQRPRSARRHRRRPSISLASAHHRFSFALRLPRRPALASPAADRRAGSAAVNDALPSDGPLLSSLADGVLPSLSTARRARTHSPGSCSDSYATRLNGRHRTTTCGCWLSMAPATPSHLASICMIPTVDDGPAFPMCFTAWQAPCEASKSR